MSNTIAPPSGMLAYVGTPAGPTRRRVPDPQPAPDEIVVQVEAFSINRGELALFADRPDGWRPGQDLAGRVLAPAADGSGPPAGTRAVAMVGFGGRARDFDLVLESVGGEVLRAALGRLAPRGHLVLLGSSSRDPAAITISSFRPHARQTIHPFWVHGSGEHVGQDLADLARLTARGLLDPVVGWTGSWHHLDQAMQALRERRVAGKAVLS